MSSTVSRSNPAERFKAHDYAELATATMLTWTSPGCAILNAEDSDNLPLPGVIAQEIVDDLLNESTAVTEALEAVKTVRGEGAT
jgi:hypothetical protein